jgi:hypothetical protein
MFGNLHCINYIFLERYKYALRCTVGILEFLYMKAAWAYPQGGQGGPWPTPNSGK